MCTILFISIGILASASIASLVLVVANETAEQEVLGSIPGSEKVILGFSIRMLLVAVTESECVPG